ncbi:MAG: BrnA antitoxin family protein [Pseudomonadota bacterium]
MVTRIPRPRKGPKTQRLAEQRLKRLLLELYDETMPSEAEWTIPEAWATLEQDIDVEEKKVKITIRLDESVVKFFRTMGVGYQARMNRVLATYAQMKIAEVRWYEGAMSDARRQTQAEAKAAAT